MTDTGKKKHRRLAHEILGLIGISALAAVVLFLILTGLARGVAEEYIFNNAVAMTEFDWLELEEWIFTVGMTISAVVFSALFLMLLSSRMAYIRAITDGIDKLGRGEQHEIPLEGSNELTALAGAINEMSQAQRRLREREQALAEEKEQFVRTLSHDIRTPLTSILAYSEYLTRSETTPEQQKAHLLMMRKKAEQIKDLTDILLDGSKRNTEHFEDARLLMQQLAAEFEETLEADFRLEIDFFRCPAFSGSLDVQELRRIFDNLSANIQKYADPAQPVRLEVGAGEGRLQIRQSNAVRTDAPRSESYRLGLHSIRRIAQHYGGSVMVAQTEKQFEITILLNVM